MLEARPRPQNCPLRCWWSCPTTQFDWNVKMLLSKPCSIPQPAPAPVPCPGPPSFGADHSGTSWIPPPPQPLGPDSVQNNSLRSSKETDLLSETLTTFSSLSPPKLMLIVIGNTGTSSSNWPLYQVEYRRVGLFRLPNINREFDQESCPLIVQSQS